MWLAKPICKKSTLENDDISYTKEEMYLWKIEIVYEEIYVGVYGTYEYLKLSKILNIAFFIFLKSKTIKFPHRVNFPFFCFLNCFCNLWRSFFNYLYYFHVSYYIHYQYPMKKKMENSRIPFIHSTTSIFFYRNNKPKYAAKILIKCDAKPRWKFYLQQRNHATTLFQSRSQLLEPVLGLK